MSETMQIRERLAQWSEPEPNTGCVLWTGTVRKDGYGKISIHSRSFSAHRVAYEVFVGPIPLGLTIDHLCRVRCCINPDHLEPVSKRVNTLRGVGITAQCAKKTHCLQGHELSGENLWLYKGVRYCRTCCNRRSREFKARRHSGVR